MDPRTATIKNKAMRQVLYSAVGALVASATYFLLLDLVRPSFQEGHLVLWWGTLGLYVVLLFSYSCWPIMRARPRFAGLGLLILATTAYSYDPTIEPYLHSIGMGWLWIVSLIALFAWILQFVKVIREQQEEKLH